MTRAASVRGWVSTVAPWSLLLIPFMLAVWLFGRYVCDDDLIMLRYAERLAQGKGLTWNDGERVHGISAMLLVLLSAGLRILGVPLEVTMRMLSAVGVLATGLVVVFAAVRAGVSRWIAFALGGALVLSAPFAVWVFAGVGGVVFAALAGWATLLATNAAAHHSRAPQEGVTRVLPTRVFVLLLALMQLVRPDALVLVLPILVVAFLGSRSVLSVRSFLFRVLAPVLGFAALFAAAQFSYFATPVPHLVGVKTTWGFEFTRVGLLYVLEFTRGFFPLVLLSPLLLALSPARRSFHVLAPLLPAMVWTTYVVWIGGDWMPGNRHFAVVLVLLLITLIRAAAHPSANRQHRLIALLIASILSAGISVTAPAALRAHDATKWLETTCRGSEDMARLVGHLDPLLGVEPAGCPPYVTGMRSLDLLGLNDLHVSRSTASGRPIAWVEWVRMQTESPEDLPSSFIPGHGNGDGTYIWNREPDLLIGCNPLRSAASGCFRSFFEMQERFDFASRYRPLVLMLDSGALWHAWVRFDAGVLGVQVTSHENHPVAIEVPVWLLTASPHAPLRVPGPDASRSTDPSGARIEINAGARLEVPSLWLSEGEWSLRGVSEHLELSTPSTCAQVDGYNLRVSSPDCSVALVLVSAVATSVGNLSLLKVS